VPADAVHAKVAPVSAMDHAEAHGAEIATALDVLQPESGATSTAAAHAMTSAPTFGPVGFEAGGEDIDDEIREARWKFPLVLEEY